MDHTIRNIVVVGGGTAGWLAAAYLDRALNREKAGQCQVTLIESTDIDTVGVGEATVPTLRQTMAFLGFDEAEWMVRCNATFKLAIKFVNWSGLPGHEVFWHPFGKPPSLKGFPLAHYWLKRKLQGHADSMASSCYSHVRLCHAQKSPKTVDDPPYEGAVNYAYHLDATLLAAYLKEKTKTRGVRHVVDNVLGVVLDEHGCISHLTTQNSGPLTGDLFIDCTGFRGLLINQALGEPFVSFADALFCDSAIAMRIPASAGQQGIEPYTTATALSAGWTWHIPLFGRSGNGYVYASAFLSKEEAEREFRQYLGPKSEQIDAWHLKMRIGMTRNPWVKNCVSIGLASGFIEPLESTGIYLIELGLYHLISYFPDKQFQPAVIQQYNQVMRHYYEHIRDFIVLHYCTTQREDTPFWRHNKYHPAVPDTLQTKLVLWESMWPLQEELFNPGLFANPSHFCILAGMGRLPRHSLPVLNYGHETAAAQEFLAIKEEAERLTQTLPDQEEYLRWLRLYEALRQAYQNDLQPAELAP